MTSWQEFIQRDAAPPEWPYPIKVDVENRVSADVLILGGGIAGCHAAINAARRGAQVVVVEKAATKRSGQGGTGVDHWQGACTNPCSTVSPEEYAQAAIDSFGGYDCGPLRYIHAKESWDALLDCEEMGVQIRDVNGEFEGADFRDPETSLMFAYDYVSRHTIRVYGHNMKLCLHKELKRLGVQIVDRVMATSLLTEGGEQGGRVVGATGVSTRTGEFYVFQAKAVVLATAHCRRLWIFSTELNGSASTFGDNNLSGESIAMGSQAGAELAMLEKTMGSGGGFAYIPYGVGYPDNTWYGCTMVDANGKEIPWYNNDGTELRTVPERFRPAPGQGFMLIGGAVTGGRNERYNGNYIARDLADRLRSGDFALPLYADLPSLPEHERRAIFGLMVGNEGKTRIPVYDIYTKAGFDPDKDMLQAPVMPPDAYRSPHYPAGTPVPQWRDSFGGGLMVDWDLRTNLEGLYSAGRSTYGSVDHAAAATTGRYAGRKAAAYAVTASEPAVERSQVDGEKARVYAPLERKRRGIGWKELNAGICRVMQDYCGEYKSEHSLRTGLRAFEELRESEAADVYARNPHELWRTLECHTLITVGELVLHASLAREASSELLNFRRLDYPETDPAEWHKLLVIKLEGDEVRVRVTPLDHYLLPPYEPSLEENYKRHCGM